MNPDLGKLQPYPFEKLKALLSGVEAGNNAPISLSVGEPRHSAPDFIQTALDTHWRGIEKYPPTRGSDELREAISQWLLRRFHLNNYPVSPVDQILPVNGTREALFAIAQCLLDRGSNKQVVLAPNPFYQIYEGAIYLAGLQPTFYNLDAPRDDTAPAGRPGYWDNDDPRWAQVQLIYICNPGNPTGQVMSKDALIELIELAERHDFIIVSDECYSEIYRDENHPPPGLLEAAANRGQVSDDKTPLDHCLVFHSLSKRSNLPGLRSGFVAGGQALIEQFLLYRTYHGCSMSPPVQAASTQAWLDETHVVNNRQRYNEKYEAVLPILAPVLPVEQPAAGFYLWPDLGMDDEQFTRDMYNRYNIAVVPGSYLSRTVDGVNPGKNHTRLALVAELEDCITAATHIRDYLAEQQ